MLTHVKIILALLALNIVSILFFCLDEISPRLRGGNEAAKLAEPIPVYSPDSPLYKFKDPINALEILKRFDKGNPEAKKHFMRHNKTIYSIIKDNHYCEKSWNSFINKPAPLFQQMNLFMTDDKRTFVRGQVFKGFVNDIHPGVGDHMKKDLKDKPTVNLKPDIHIYWNKNPLFTDNLLGVHLSCLNQQSNHIPGHGTIDRKDNVAINAKDYALQFKGRPQCFNHDKFFPQTWILPRKADCQDFFKRLNSEAYQAQKKERKIVYIRKVSVGSHRGEGVQPVDQKEEDDLKSQYANGLKCGQNKENLIIQTFIHNPLLINGRKFDFRMYMLIASTNPLIAFYHDGFLRVTLAQYQVDIPDKKVLLTNLALNKQIYDEVKGGKLYEGMDEESLKLAQQWSFAQLQEYLLQIGKINDPNWLDNYLRPEFKKAMIHLLRLSSYKFLKHSSIYELYGVDFMLDENLNLWFIEANSSPALHGYSKPMAKFITQMLRDHLEVMASMLRSRMKRVIKLVNQMTDEKRKKKLTGKAWEKYLKGKEQDFKKATLNGLEKEFMPRPENGFSKIIDVNLSGVDKYQGLISQECL